MGSIVNWCVYIVECKDRSLYTGITNDLRHRVVEHNRAKGARYTRYRRPVRLVYWEEAENRSVAAQREAQVKSWSRRKKLAFIECINRMRRIEKATS
ncbi:MAG: GIY-YIG nuclease family protein [Nitrospirae bacterium]|nr:GIY-YIG nuclease family protein [Nitrospirota bacterium]